MNCNCCSILSSTATVAIDSGNTFILISPSKALSPENEDRVKIKIVNSVPTAGATLPVAITFGSSNVYLYDKYGNAVYGNDLYNGLILRGYYGNNGAGGTAHFQLVGLPHRYYC